MGSRACNFDVILLGTSASPLGRGATGFDEVETGFDNFWGSGFPAPVACGVWTFPVGKGFETPKLADLGTDFGETSGPVERMKSAKSRKESSFVVGSRAVAPGDLGPGVFVAALA